jgi:hypothetical protein
VRSRAVIVEQLAAVPIERCVVDIAGSSPLELSIPVVDAALARGVERAALWEATLSLSAASGIRRAQFAVRFGDPRSGSPGESLSRTSMFRAGIPSPRLQTAHHDDAGLIGVSDFDWPDQRLVGEFDGLGKYREDLSGRGREPWRIVHDEKVREDRIRALGFTVVRWDWKVAWSPTALRALLVGRGGLRPTPVLPRR